MHFLFSPKPADITDYISIYSQDTYVFCAPETL